MLLSSRIPEQPARRAVLKSLAALTAGALLLPRWAQASSPLVGEEVRSLSFLHLHTGERLRVDYWEQGSYVPDALARINHVLRDFRNDAVKPIDPALLDMLARLQGALGTRREFHIISAYRSPETNSRLRSNSNGVAKHSLHLEAKAIDIRIPGIPLADVRRAALAMQSGGVGYYPKSDFVHVDTGRVRQWGGA